MQYAFFLNREIDGIYKWYIYCFINLTGSRLSIKLPIQNSCQIDKLGRMTIMGYHGMRIGIWRKPPNSLQPKGTVSNYRCLGRRWHGKIHRAIFPRAIFTRDKFTLSPTFPDSIFIFYFLPYQFIRDTNLTYLTLLPSRFLFTIT